MVPQALLLYCPGAWSRSAAYKAGCCPSGYWGWWTHLATHPRNYWWNSHACPCHINRNAKHSDTSNDKFVMLFPQDTLLLYPCSTSTVCRYLADQKTAKGCGWSLSQTIQVVGETHRSTTSYNVALPVERRFHSYNFIIQGDTQGEFPLCLAALEPAGRYISYNLEIQRSISVGWHNGMKR